MKIEKTMLIGELIHMDELIPQMPGLPVFSGRVSGRGMHGSWNRLR